MDVENSLASIRSLFETFENGEEATDYLNHLTQERGNLVRQLKKATSTPDQDRLEKHINETDLVIKAFEARHIVRKFWTGAPGKLQIPFRDANDPEILLNFAPFARRVECLIQRNKDEEYATFMDVVDAINVIELIDTFRAFAGLMNDTKRLPYVAGVLPEMVRRNFDKIHGGKATLFRTVAQVDFHGLEHVLDSVSLVKVQLDRLPFGTRLLLSEPSQELPFDTRLPLRESIQQGCEKEFRGTVRRTVQDVVWEKSLGSEKPELTSFHHLTRACLQVIMRFDLKRSSSGTYAELLGVILSQPGMLHAGFSTEARTNAIRRNFEHCIYPSRFNDDWSFDAIVAYAEHHKGTSFKTHWSGHWSVAIKVMREMGTEAGVVWGISPFSRAC